MRTSRNLAAVAIASVATLVFASSAFAATLSYTAFGETAPAGGGAVTLISDTTAGHAGYGGLDFSIPSGLTFADITNLDTTQVAAAGDTCNAGSPRFAIQLDTNNDNASDGSVFVYTQTGGQTAGCPSPTGNLAMAGGPGDVAGVYDTSQLTSGTQISTYSATLASFGTATVLGIQLVVDSGWNATASGGDGIQSITVNPTVETAAATATNKDDCKQGGWQQLQRADGTSFKNQGDCIQYVNTGK